MCRLRSTANGSFGGYRDRERERLQYYNTAHAITIFSSTAQHSTASPPRQTLTIISSQIVSYLILDALLAWAILVIFSKGPVALHHPLPGPAFPSGVPGYLGTYRGAYLSVPRPSENLEMPASCRPASTRPLFQPSNSTINLLIPSHVHYGLMDRV